jgi:hypothetical protein
VGLTTLQGGTWEIQMNKVTYGDGTDSWGGGGVLGGVSRSETIEFHSCNKPLARGSLMGIF